jgi:hypothetical protein
MGAASGPIARTLADPRAAMAESLSDTTVAPPPKEDRIAFDARRLDMDEDWQLQAEVNAACRLVENLRSQTLRFDSPAPLQPLAPHAPALPPRGVRAASRPPEPDAAAVAPRPKAASPTVSLLAWSILSLGMAVFACGGVLVAWSLVAAREDLWPIGMPLALLGQAALVLGLVLQLDGLWNTSRRTADSIEALDDELVRVRQATTLLASSHSTPAQSFYVHLAEGAPPQLLLADLKGQLDLLAEQMARQR